MKFENTCLSYEAYPSTPADDTDTSEGQDITPDAPVEPQQKYTSGQITIRNSDGTETRGILTGYVDDDGRHEYYVEGDLTHLHYATGAELDNILSNYKPDEPQGSTEPEQDAEPQVPADVADHEKYKEAYASALEQASQWTPKQLEEEIKKLSEEPELLTDYGRGMLDAYLWHQKKDGPQPAEPMSEQPIVEIEQPQLTDEQICQSADAAFQQATQGNNCVFTLPQEQIEGMQRNQQFYEQEQLRKEEEVNRQPTPLERIPRNENGEPAFEQAGSPDVAWDALVEFSGGDAATAKEIADAMTEEKRKALDKAKKLKLKGKTPTEMLASKQANAAELAKAENEFNQWQRMATVEQSRQNAIRAQQEAEARRLAAEREEAEKAERAAREEAERKEREASEGIPEWHMDTPEFEEFGNELEPIAYIPTRFISLVIPTLKDKRIYCGKGYFIDHALRNHGGAGTQISPEDVDVSKYLNIQSVLDNPDTIKETMSDGKRTVVFIKKIGRFFAELTQVEEDGKIVLHKSLFNQKKEPYVKLNDIRQEDTSSEGGTSSISHAENSAPAISLQSRGDVVSSEKNEHTEKSSISGGKGTTLPSDQQTSEEENSKKVVDSEGKSILQAKIDAASADVNTDPTDA